MNFIRNRRGQGMLEYVIILAVIVAVVIFFKGQFDQNARAKVADMAREINR